MASSRLGFLFNHDSVSKTAHLAKSQGCRKPPPEACPSVLSQKAYPRQHRERTPSAARCTSDNEPESNKPPMDTDTHRLETCSSTISWKRFVTATSLTTCENWSFPLRTKEKPNEAKANNAGRERVALPAISPTVTLRRKVSGGAAELLRVLFLLQGLTRFSLRC